MRHLHQLSSLPLAGESTYLAKQRIDRVHRSLRRRDAGIGEEVRLADSLFTHLVPSAELLDSDWEGKD